MTKILFGLFIGFAVGAFCRWADVPAPAPPKMIGALVVVAVTLGYTLTDMALSHRPATTAHLCGGPSGETIAQSAVSDRLPRP